MNSIERVAAAIDFRTPDRVPVDLHNFQVAAIGMRVSMSDMFQNGELLAEAMIKAWREFGHDMLLLENGTACNAQACGVKVIYREDSSPVATEPVVNNISDLDLLQVPDPYKAFPMCEILKATKIVVGEIGKQAWIVGRADQGPMDLACQLRGTQRFMMDIADGNLELVHRLLNFARQVTTRYAYALIQAGAHSTSIGEPLSGPELIGPRNYRKLAQPYQRQMAEELKAQGIILANHICGDTIPIINDFVATGAQILEIDHKTDSQKAKDAARHKTCLLGNIDTGLLARGTPQEVDDACRNTIEIMAPDSGFILGPGCAMGPETPPDNIHALVEAAQKYGKYL